MKKPQEYDPSDIQVLLLRYPLQGWVLYECLIELGERRISLHDDPMFPAALNGVMLYVHGVDLKLIHYWLDLGHLKQVLNVVGDEVGDTDEFQRAGLHELLKSFPGTMSVFHMLRVILFQAFRGREMQEHEVDVLQIEVSECNLDGLLGLLIPHHVIEYLGGYEEVAALQAELLVGQLHLATHELLILVIGGGVDVSVPVQYRVEDWLLGLDVIAAEPDLRHFGLATAAIVQGQGFLPDVLGIEVVHAYGFPSLLNKMIREGPDLSHIIN